MYSSGRERLGSTLLLVLLLAAVALASLHGSNEEGYLFFHILVEVFSIVVACGIFIVSWHSRRILDNPYFLFIGIAYLFVAFLDLCHTITYENMGVYLRVSPAVNPLGDPAIEFWIAARYSSVQKNCNISLK